MQNTENSVQRNNALVKGKFWFESCRFKWLFQQL